MNLQKRKELQKQTQTIEKPSGSDEDKKIYENKIKEIEEREILMELQLSQQTEEIVRLKSELESLIAKIEEHKKIKATYSRQKTLFTESNLTISNWESGEQGDEPKWSTQPSSELGQEELEEGIVQGHQLSENLILENMSSDPLKEDWQRPRRNKRDQPYMAQQLFTKA
ncbi:hypothetical protein HHI36_004744 [Cryptolaemus montrouzieri]|uniref:Uncharacterized protein n=1 Tax=Cryptolaemus montrouzieri TaxID=559131 RepID=A0ABD2NS23_9CUCU